MIATRFSTERLELLPLEVRYAGEMAGVLSAGELYEFTGGEAPSADELADRYRRQLAGLGRPDEYWLNWVISLDGVLVGYVQATVTDVAEVAWVVGKDWHRQGIAREAAIGLVGWLDGDRKIVAHVHPEHAASQAVAKAAGLSRTDQLDDGEEVWTT
jgi:RimJ/RimL family protein N-acetyltransferase